MNEKESKNQELAKLREEVNHIDDNIIEAINKRAQIVLKIGDIKKELGMEVFQPDRELNVIKRIQEKSKILKPRHVEEIWKELMGACKDVQGNIMKVGYLGPEGTFTNQAALEFFSSAGTEFIPEKTLSDIFQNIEKEILDFGVIAIENSLQGTVRETLDLLIEKDLRIYGEVELRIKQNLISIQEASIEDIKNVYSHPQAFAQTRSWIKANMPTANLINTRSTAEALKMVMELKSKENAAIGTEFAAKIYGLKILSSNIEDLTTNYTRFLIISREENPIKKEGNIKTSIVYVTKHVPGALYNVLKLFAEAGVNLSKIESRPRRKGRWEYIFLMDFEGEKDEERIKKVLSSMQDHTVWHKILGSYPMS